MINDNDDNDKKHNRFIRLERTCILSSKAYMSNQPSTGVQNVIRPTHKGIKSSSLGGRVLYLSPGKSGVIVKSSARMAPTAHMSVKR